MKTFKSLGLSEPLVRSIVKSGYATPTPIQAAAIPPAILGQDLTGCAQTGTGKTAAFVLPMLDRLLPASDSNNKKKWRPVRALVVTPTRELALQVAESVRTYGQFTGIRSTAVFGGVGYGPQINAFRKGIDIVIATPGRLLDHMSNGKLDLSKVEILVLDEADRMFDMGFEKDVRKIVAAMPRQRQTLLFSATMPPAIQKLAASIQHKPKLIEIGEQTNPAKTVTQRFYRVAPTQKNDLLLHVLENEDVKSMLVFSRTRHRANRISQRLKKKGIRSAPIHSDRTQGQRQRALADFKSGKVQVLVATDIAARGIDVDGISHVINFDTPPQAEDYIHRIGRTGRAENSGLALTFVSPDEVPYVRTISRVTGNRISRDLYPGFNHAAETVAEPAEVAPAGKKHHGGRPPWKKKGGYKGNKKWNKRPSGRRK
jgi:ATP-dependent RNA helicase RhlE